MVGYYAVLSELMARNMTNMRAYADSSAVRDSWDEGRPATPWEMLDESGRALAMISCRRYLGELDEMGLTLSSSKTPLDEMTPEITYRTVRAPYFDAEGNGCLIDVMSTEPFVNEDLEGASLIGDDLAKKYGEGYEWAVLAFMIFPALGIEISGIKERLASEPDGPDNRPAESILGNFPAVLETCVHSAANAMSEKYEGVTLPGALEDCILAMDVMAAAGFEFQKRCDKLQYDFDAIRDTLNGGMFERLRRLRQYTSKRKLLNSMAVAMMIESMAGDGVAVYDKTGEYSDESFGYRVSDGDTA